MASPISLTSSRTTTCEETVQPCASISSSSEAPASSWARSRVSEHVTIEIFNSTVFLLQHRSLGQVDANNVHDIARRKVARTLVNAQQAVGPLHRAEQRRILRLGLGHQQLTGLGVAQNRRAIEEAAMLSLFSRRV